MLFPQGVVKLIALEKLSQGLLFCKIVDILLLRKIHIKLLHFNLVTSKLHLGHHLFLRVLNASLWVGQFTSTSLT